MGQTAHQSQSMNQYAIFALMAALASGGTAANAQSSYGLGGNYTFKTAPSMSSAKPPALSMPRNPLGAVAPPPSISPQNLRPTAPSQGSTAFDQAVRNAPIEARRTPPMQVENPHGGLRYQISPNTSIGPGPGNNSRVPGANLRITTP